MRSKNSIIAFLSFARTTDFESDTPLFLYRNVFMHRDFRLKRAIFEQPNDWHLESFSNFSDGPDRRIARAAIDIRKVGAM
jgi:hypothetical protein